MINEKLKELRLQNNLTQTDMAKILNISRSTYNNYEQKIATPSLETILKLADYFHTTTDNLLEHKVPYFLDISTLSNEQKEIIETVKQMNYEECRIMLAYINGVKKGIEERNAIFNKKGEF